MNEKNESIKEISKLIMKYSNGKIEALSIIREKELDLGLNKTPIIVYPVKSGYDMLFMAGFSYGNRVIGHIGYAYYYEDLIREISYGLQKESYFSNSNDQRKVLIYPYPYDESNLIDTSICKELIVPTFGNGNYLKNKDYIN